MEVIISLKLIASKIVSTVEPVDRSYPMYINAPRAQRKGKRD